MDKAFSKLGMNQCPFCHTDTLAVWEFEVTGFTLDRYGHKHTLITTEENGCAGYDVHLTCMSCGRSFPADTKGNSWFIKKDNPVSNHTKGLLSFNPFQE